MVDILFLVSEAERKAFPTLSQLSENDIDSIWAYVSTYIERQMTAKKGVCVAGLGTFTFSQQKLDMGNRFIMIQRPIFLLAEKLSRFQGIKQARPLAAATSVPVVQLNYTAVSQDSPYDRGAVEACVRETLLLLLRALTSKRNVVFNFQGIGVLSFKNNKVQMKFNREFVNTMDGTGKLLLAFANRPGSCASLMSGRPSGLRRLQTAPVSLPRVGSPETGSGAGGKDGRCVGPAPDPDRTESHTGDPQPRQSKSRQMLQPAKVNGICLCEELNPKPPVEATDKSTISVSPPEGARRAEEPHMNVSCTDHTRAGQELCYLCMQRAQKNIPLYLKEETMAEEHAQQMLLLSSEQQRDMLYLQEEQANRSEQREHSKQTAAFNLDVSEALREEKARRPQFHSSYIFPERPFTPALKTKQRRYMDELQTQIACRSHHSAQAQQERLLLERLQQVQQAQQIALQKSQEFQQKQEKAQHYQRALDTQMENWKGAGLPEHQPNAGFGRCETPSTIAESRQRAQKLFQEQLTTATQKRKDELSRRQAQQQKESEMLSRNRRELILDRITRFEKTRNLRSSLEDTWRRSSKLKNQRDEEEKRFLRSGAHLLIDQCEQLRRCYQCKRKTSNRGESNIFDSRLMI
ncbi:coiled-coil domain-containing protein 81-like [Polymixia lowei]